MVSSSMSIVAPEALKKFATDIFTKAGLPAKDAETVASVMLWANLRGVDSHGVQLIPWYVQGIDIGHMKVKPNIKVEKETPATMLIEADHALGAVVTVWAMNQAMEKAKKTGIGWAFIRHNNHQGAMGYYSQMAAEKGMAGIATVCSVVNMVPFGAKAMGISNSPIAISVPARRYPPMTLDMATSVAAASKIMLAKDKGISIPPDWAFDADGNPTTDPNKAAMLLPFGGAKGSGLSIMLECLCSIMVNNPLLEPVLQGKKPPLGLKPFTPETIPLHLQNSIVAAIDISHFTDLESYKEHIDNLIDGIKALPKAKGFNEIFVPGEPEERTYLERSKKGIPMAAKTIANLKRIADRFGVSLPPGMS